MKNILLLNLIFLTFIGQAQFTTAKIEMLGPAPEWNVPMSSPTYIRFYVKNGSEAYTGSANLRVTIKNNDKIIYCSTFHKVDIKNGWPSKEFLPLPSVQDIRSNDIELLSLDEDVEIPAIVTHHATQTTYPAWMTYDSLSYKPRLENGSIVSSTKNNRGIELYTGKVSLDSISIAGASGVFDDYVQIEMDTTGSRAGLNKIQYDLFKKVIPMKASNIIPKWFVIGTGFISNSVYISITKPAPVDWPETEVPLRIGCGPRSEVLEYLTPGTLVQYLGNVQCGEYEADRYYKVNFDKIGYINYYELSNISWPVTDLPHQSIRLKQAETRPSNVTDDASVLLFLQSHIQYPQMERDNNIDGKVILNFTIETDGHVNNIEITRSVSPGLDKEAVRVAKLFIFPSGQRRQYSLPVTFRLQ